MLTVARVHLQTDVPVVGCEIVPYVLLRRVDGCFMTDDDYKLAPVDGYCVKYKWLVVFLIFLLCICNDVIFGFDFQYVDLFIDLWIVYDVALIC